MNHTIASLFHINPRFLRSTHLERDFTTPDSCRGYILTDFTKSCLERLADGLVAGSTKRAWRLTGDYGTGKSSFALVLAHLFSGHHGVLENLQKVVLNPDLSEAVDIDGGGKENLNIIPILVTGNRLPLRIALFRALRKYLAAAYTNDSKTLSPRLQHIVKIGDDIPSIDDEEIVEALVQFSKVVKSDSKGSGVLLILDELGKFLEFAAMYPERQDIYLLQQLAEAASRSGDTPLFVLGLLHQGVSAYTDHLDGASKGEWEKVAGRFEEIPFNQPLEQVVVLLSSALGVRSEDVPIKHRKEATAQMEFAIEQGYYGPVPLRSQSRDSFDGLLYT